MTDYCGIMLLRLQGLSYRQIVARVGCSHRAVSKASTSITTGILTGQADLNGLSDEEIASCFADGHGDMIEGFITPDSDRMIRTRSRASKPSLKALWLEYCSTSAPAGKRHYGLDRFRELVNDPVAEHDLVAVMSTSQVKHYRLTGQAHVLTW